MSHVLDDLLRRRIATDGPIRIDDWWQTCLYHPEHGYYASRVPVLQDFVTAPEISQVFGELIGLTLAQAWLEHGSPAEASLVEIGPGRGTLARDLWRALAIVPAARRAMAPMVLVETGRALRQVQQDVLAGQPCQWVETVEETPGTGPLFLVANELLDALPIRQLVRGPEQWHERRIGLDEAGRFGMILEDRPSPLGIGLPDAQPGTVHELAPAREAMAASIGRLLHQRGGAALLIDYGDAYRGPTGDTIQLVRSHRKIDDLFEAPGEVDVSSRVDFTPLVRALRLLGCRVAGPVPQGVYLERLGATLRTQVLAKGRDHAGALDLHDRTRRLVDPAGMGQLFKVLGVAGPHSPLPPGFLDEEIAR